jgi:putative cell wall-binding protein
VWAGLAQTSGVALATSQNFPDALSAVPFARYGSALLLVPGSCVPSVTFSTITRLASSNVTLFGGPAALAAPVETLSVC